MFLWAYEIVAYAWPLRFHVGASILASILVDGLVLRLLGAVLVLAGLLVYGIALHDLGASWRLGFDRTRPGPLVTGGIYGRMRHPIYVAFDLLFVGTFLVLNRSIFPLLALVMVPLLDAVMRREERFFTEPYGDAYRNYEREKPCKQCSNN